MSLFSFWIILSIVAPIVAAFVHRRVKNFHVLLDVVAFITLVSSVNFVAITLYDILHHDRLYMTSIHGILVNPYLFSCVLYLAFYALYRMVCNILK